MNKACVSYWYCS